MRLDLNREQEYVLGKYGGFKNNHDGTWTCDVNWSVQDEKSKDRSFYFGTGKMVVSEEALRVLGPDELSMEVRKKVIKYAEDKCSL